LDHIPLPKKIKKYSKITSKKLALNAIYINNNLVFTACECLNSFNETLREPHPNFPHPEPPK